jgi:RHS repeat-associated protein
MLNSSGSIVARYSYDPYGRTTLVSGSNLATFQYTGDYCHATSGLNLTLYRAYDSNTGRWLCEDPLGAGGGTNLYNFCDSNPIDSVDTLGLSGGPTPQQAMGAYASGMGGSFSMGQNDDWTQQLAAFVSMNGPIMSKIKAALRAYCAGGGQGGLPGGQANYNLNDPAQLSPLNAPNRLADDAASYATGGAIGTSPALWFGSFRLHWQASYVDCCKKMALISFHAWDKIGIHSMTRVPGTSLGLPDNDTGQGPLRSVFLDWRWFSAISF